MAQRAQRDPMLHLGGPGDDPLGETKVADLEEERERVCVCVCVCVSLSFLLPLLLLSQRRAARTLAVKPTLETPSFRSSTFPGFRSPSARERPGAKSG